MEVKVMAKKSKANINNKKKNLNIIDTNEEIAQELNVDEVRKMAREYNQQKKNNKYK